MNVTRTAALALFAAIGMKNADKWNNKRMEAKLAKVDEMVDTKTKIEDKAADKLLNACLKAITNSEEITVTDDAAPAAADTKAEKAGAEAAKDVKGAGDAKAKAATDKAAKDAEKKAAAEKAKADAAAKKAAQTPGVRETRTRPYLAGVIICKHGMDAGVTEDMAKELDEAYGKENPTESLFTLRNAWHAIRGFRDQTKEAKK